MDRSAQKADNVGRLWTIEDVSKHTGWSRTSIFNLCTSGEMPYIPSKPRKFVEEDVRKALIQMQVGGRYGRRKPRKAKATAKATV